MCWRWRVLGLYIYISRDRLRRRQKRDEAMKTKRERRRHCVEVKMPMIAKRGGRCELCGREVTWRDSEIHHVLPYHLYEEWRDDERNAMVVCKDCHRAVHRNPVRMAKMMEERAKELGVELVR